MSQSFSEFLRQHAKKHQEEFESKRLVIEEWRGAIGRLFDRIQDWIKSSDPDEIVQITQTDTEANEISLGKDKVPRLDIRILGKWVGLIPKARHTVARAHPPLRSSAERAAGRIDMTDELLRFVFLRFDDEGEDVWHIVDWDSREQRPLDQDSFEKALMSYLQ